MAYICIPVYSFDLRCESVTYCFKSRVVFILFLKFPCCGLMCGECISLIVNICSKLTYV